VIEYLASALTIGAIACILTLGLNVRWGWAGEFDLAYYAFVAIGAYMGGVAVLGRSDLPGSGAWILGLHQNFVVGVLVAMVSSAVVSIALGAVALRRLRGDYFAITTVAFALIVTAIGSQETKLFNAFNGLFGVPQPFQDQFDAFSYPYFFFGLCVAILIVVYVLVELMYRSPFGRTLRIIREDEIAAAAFGRNVYLAKLQAYAIGGAIAGLGGFLFATYLTAWNPQSWAAIETFLLYSAIFLGGQANARGVILGTLIVLVAVPEGTRFLPPVPGHPDLFPALRQVVSGLLILAVLRWRPQGLIPEVRPLDRIRSRGPREPRVQARTPVESADA
jgi:ABC-type branched-subunit amino acid transport system permease subunit